MVNRNSNPASRRSFLQAVATLPLLPAVGSLLPQIANPSTGFEEILPGLTLCRGSVNTALIQRNNKKLLVDCGEIASLPDKGAPEWALFTHHHRDQALGVSPLAAAGTKVIVPSVEMHFFAAAREFSESAYSILRHR